MKNKLISCVGRSCCMLAGGIAGFAIGGIIFAVAGAVVGIFCGYFLEKGILNQPV